MTSRASFFSASGARLGDVPPDFRAHGLAEHGSGIVVLPRRPGARFALVVRRTLEIVAIGAAPAGRHFHGHGAFTTDGRGRLCLGGQIAAPDRARGDGVVWLVQGGDVDRQETGVPMGGHASTVAAHEAGALVTSKETGVVLHLDGASVVAVDRIEGGGAAALGRGLTAA